MDTANTADPRQPVTERTAREIVERVAAVVEVVSAYEPTPGSLAHTVQKWAVMTNEGAGWTVLRSGALGVVVQVENIHIPVAQLAELVRRGIDLGESRLLA